jgi:hypothetical protein
MWILKNKFCFFFFHSFIIVSLIFSCLRAISIRFWGLLRSIKRCRLGVLNHVLWVCLYFWGLCWVETGISLFHSIANIHIVEFATFSNGDSSRPSEGSNHVYCIGSGAFFARCNLIILLSIATDTRSPGDFKLHDGSMFGKSAEAFFSLVFIIKLGELFLSFFFRNTSRTKMGSATILKNNRKPIAPGFE